MRKIIVAGAGHGGLLSASQLATEGFDVNVYEKLPEKELGYDWHDDLKPQVFKDCNINILEEGDYHLKDNISFVSPNLKTLMDTNVPDEMREIAVHRKLLYEKLIAHCKKCGVKLNFECTVTSPLIKDNVVVGIEYLSKGKSIKEIGDLVIDSAGMDSPLRKNLPDSYEIPKNFERGEIFYAYRGYYEFENDIDKIKATKLYRNDGSKRFKTYFGFQGIRGIAWYRIEEGLSDILFGKIDPYKDGEIDALINKMRKINPCLGEKLLHGGSIEKIPIRRTFEKIVGPNYVAIGDCAAMTIPLQGSGLENSFYAGSILTSVVKDIVNNSNLDNKDTLIKYPVEKLWSYEYQYVKKIGVKMVGVQYLKDYMLTLPWKELDFLFNKELLKASDFEAPMMGQEVDISFGDLFGRIMRGVSKVFVLLGLKNATGNVLKAKKVADKIPEEYDEDKIRKWANEIKSLFNPFKEKLKDL